MKRKYWISIFWKLYRPKTKIKKMNINSKSYKTIFLNTAYFDRTEYFPQSFKAIFVNF